MIAIEHLSARFGDFRLDDISLALDAGHSLVILGPSGAGKTLLLETIMGVRAPEAGGVRIDGADVLRLPPEARRISYIPQDLALFPHLSVRENVLFGRGASPRRFDALVERLGLGGMLDRDPASLSGGERQRVALARALVVEPRVLFLDEPFSALDRVSRLEALALLRSLKAELGTTTVHVTHDLEEASALADDLGILMGGRLAQQGARDAVLGRPRSREVASLLLIKNILPAGALGMEAATPWWAIRPEEIVLLERDDGRPNCFEARVEDAVLLASRWSIVLAVGDVRLEASLQPGRFRVLRPEPGRRIVAHLPPEAIVFLQS